MPGTPAASTVATFLQSPVDYFNPVLQLVPRIAVGGDALTGRTALARRLRDTARRASGTLGSFSPPMNRVRYTPARLLHALRFSLPHAPAGHDPQPTDAPAPQRSSPMRSAGEWDVPVVVGHAPTRAPVPPTEFKEQDLYRPHSACGSIGPSSNVKNNGEGHVRRAPKHR